jgi:hypothetical protein
MTALTFYAASAASSTLSTADKLYVIHGVDNTNVTTSLTLIDNSTGYVELYPQGNASNGVVGSLPSSPSGHGFLWDVTTLEGQTIASGNWSGNIRLASQQGQSFTADIYRRIWKRSSGGSYTLIVTLLLTAQSFTGTNTTYALPSNSASSSAFATGDKCYIEEYLHITANSGTSGQQVRYNRLSTDTSGLAGDSNSQTVTPGYSATAAALSATLAGVGTLTGTLSAKLTLPSVTLAGVGTLSGTLSRGYPLSGTLAGVGTLTGTLSLGASLSATLAGVGSFSGSISVPSASSLSIVSLFYQKIQQVQIFDPYGKFLSIWPDAPHISGLKDTVNCAQGQIRMVLPRTIDNFDALGHPGTASSLALMNGVKIYIFGPGLPKTGLLKFNGFIDTIEPSVTDSQQQSVTVTLTPWSSVFGDHGYGGSHQFNNIDPIALFQYWFNTTDSVTGAKYTYPMTWAAGNPTNSGKTVNYLIQQQDLKSIADAVLTMLGSGWFWRPNPDNTVTLNQVAATAQHTFQLGRHFASMSYSLDNTQRKNAVYFTGASQSVKGISVGATALPADQGGIGERLLQTQDSRITDNTSAKVISDALLSINDVTQVRAKFRVVDYRGNVGSGGLGYDIENLKVGDTCIIRNSRGQVTAQSQGNTIFNQILPIASIDYNFSYCDVEAGILAPSQHRRLFQLQRKFQDFTLGV